MKKTDIIDSLIDIADSVRNTNSAAASNIDILAAKLSDYWRQEDAKAKQPTEPPSWDDAPATATHRMFTPFGYLYLNRDHVFSSYEYPHLFEKRPEKPKSELKPCPFCGESPFLRISSGCYPYIVCSHCKTETRVFPTAPEAVAFWNSRV